MTLSLFQTVKAGKCQRRALWHWSICYNVDTHQRR